jgi:hypothetical protein
MTVSLSATPRKSSRLPVGRVAQNLGFDVAAESPEADFRRQEFVSAVVIPGLEKVGVIGQAYAAGPRPVLVDDRAVGHSGIKKFESDRSLQQPARRQLIAERKAHPCIHHGARAIFGP